MRENLPRALAFVLKWEGGYVNDPSDPGGATNKGVTQAVYNDWREDKNLPNRGVQAITPQEVSAIYEARYWNASACGALPGPVDLVMFDSAVNCGVHRAAVWLQLAVGATTDGQIGPKSLAAIKAYLAKNPATQLAASILVYRAAHYDKICQENPKLLKFARGWANRLASLKEEADLG